MIHWVRYFIVIEAYFAHYFEFSEKFKVTEELYVLHVFFEELYIFEKS
jgi:hypothetical protein